MLETITTKRARELRDKYPKFFGSEFDAKVRRKYALSGLANKHAQFIEYHIEEYKRLEERALAEHESEHPTNYLLIAQNFSRDKKQTLSEDGKVSFVTGFFDWYKDTYFNDSKHPYMKGFMTRLLEAKKDLDLLKQKKDERHTHLLLLMNVIDEIYTYIVSCVTRGVTPCRDYICHKLYDLSVLVLFDTEKNKENIDFFLLNEVVLKHYKFIIPNVVRNTRHAFKTIFSSSKNAWKQPHFLSEIKLLKNHTEKFMLMYEEGVYRKSRFEEAEVVKRVNERLNNKK